MRRPASNGPSAAVALLLIAAAFPVARAAGAEPEQGLA